MRLANAGRQLHFDSWRFSGKGGKGIGSAGKMSSLGAVYKSMRKNAPNYGKAIQTSMAAKSYKQRAAYTAAAKLKAQRTRNQGLIEAARIQASGAKSAARSQAMGSMIGTGLQAAGTIGAAMILAPALSDIRVKNTVERIDNALDTLRKLNPVSFYYNEEYSCSPERIHYGFIAQEYAEHMPDATYFDDDAGMMCIDTHELIGLLVRGIQQLETKLTRIEANQALQEVN